MPVVDASVVFEFLVEGPGFDAAEESLRPQHGPLWAPYLLDAEVGHALRRAVLRDVLEADEAGASLWELDELPLRRVEHELLVHSAWELRDNVSFYDGLYVALAEMLDEPLVTFDAKLARAGVDAQVEVLPGGA